MKCTLITGGARSGKSRYAQELALREGGKVLFVATASPGDEEMRRRIEAHRKARPPAWNTLEATTNVGRRISRHIEKAPTVIVDCITLLVNNVLMPHDESAEAAVEKEVMAEINELVRCIDRNNADFIIVTNEVGLGLVPTDRLSRLYRDLLGRANQVLAERADEVILMVAGLPVRIKSAP